MENIRSQDYSTHIDIEKSEELMLEAPIADSTDMDQFAVTRPTPPRRRRPIELFYEGIFLLISIMIVKRNNFENIKKQNFSIAVGNFDGIHRGHKYLLDALLKYKKTDNSKVAVLSFTPHPIKIMAPNKWKKNLVRFRTKYEKLKLLGLDALFLLSFSKKFSETSAEQFIVKYLINMLNVKNIVVGEDFRFGYNREGNVNLLKKYQEKGAFNVEAIKKKIR